MVRGRWENKDDLHCHVKNNCEGRKRQVERYLIRTVAVGDSWIPLLGDLTAVSFEDYDGAPRLLTGVHINRKTQKKAMWPAVIMPPSVIVAMR